MNLILEHLLDFDFAIIGHRGAAGLAPENTLQSFRLALQWHCPMIELDVFATSNEAGQTDLLVIHDAQLNRTTNGRGAITNFSTNHLRTLDAGNGQSIPYLSEVIDLLLNHRTTTGTTVALNIELKGPHTAAPLATMLTGITELPILVSSFTISELRHFRALDATTPIAPLYGRYSDSWRQTAAELMATAVNLSAKAVTPKRVSAIRAAGYRVFAYTVNDIDEARHLKEMGASGVFTDRPDQLMVLMENNS